MSGQAKRPIQSPIHWVPGSFPGEKLPGHKADHSFPFSAEVKE